MESQKQEVLSPNPKPNSIVQNPCDVHSEKKQEGSIGVLEVFIHQARDIHNICIYHKQDVYAKICLTNDPNTTVSTHTVNGGGKNPVFNESLRLDVQTIDSSLKCEIWMMSRVRNYLEDQSLGFAIVPLSEVVAGNGKLSKEFSLSSSDMFHSLSGFVQLSLAYTGSSPEVLEIPAAAVNLAKQGIEELVSVADELDKIEFPDPNIANENEMMVSEYYQIPCADLESPSNESFNVENNSKSLLESTSNQSLGVENNSKSPDSEDTVVQIGECSSMGVDSAEVSTIETLPSSDSTSDPPKKDNGEAVSGSADKFVAPVISVKVEPEQTVVQQDIVDMYMKSMQQFTESLAKMKLPLDSDKGCGGGGGGGSGDTGSEKTVQAPNNNGRSPRVFYGSRAFF